MEYTKKSRNSKLKEKYYLNEKTHLATEKKIVIQYSLKINKWGVLISFRGVGKNLKINKYSPFIKHLRVMEVTLILISFES